MSLDLISTAEREIKVGPLRVAYRAWDYIPPLGRNPLAKLTNLDVLLFGSRTGAEAEAPTDFIAVKGSSLHAGKGYLDAMANVGMIRRKD